jgi:hypothetical protein
LFVSLLFSVLPQGAAWFVFPAIPDSYKGILAPERVVTNAPRFKWDDVDTMPVVRE